MGFLFQLCTGLKASLVRALRTIITYYNKNRNSTNIYKEHFKLNMNMNDLTRKRTNSGHLTEDIQAASSIWKYAQHPMSLRSRKFKQWHNLLEWLKPQNWPLIQTNAGQDTEQRGLPFIPGPAEWYNPFERTLSTRRSKESSSQKTQQWLPSSLFELRSHRQTLTAAILMTAISQMKRRPSARELTVLTTKRSVLVFKPLEDMEEH